MKYSRDKQEQKLVKGWKEHYLGEVLILVFHKNSVILLKETYCPTVDLVYIILGLKSIFLYTFQ